MSIKKSPSLMLRFTEDDFDSDQALTIGVDFKTKTVCVDDVMVKLAIWDTAGQERFRTLTPSYYRYLSCGTLSQSSIRNRPTHPHTHRDAQGAILVYDTNKRPTFQKLESWLNELDIYGTRPNMAKIVVGNKIDVDRREVSRDEGLRFAKKHQTIFVETSAKTSEGVGDAFDEVVRRILETEGLWDRRTGAPGSGGDAVNMGDGPTGGQSSCAC